MGAGCLVGDVPAGVPTLMQQEERHRLDRQKRRLLQKLKLEQLRHFYRARLRGNLTQGELALRLGLSREQINRWLNGAHSISEVRAEEIDLVVGLHGDDLEMRRRISLIEGRIVDFCDEAIEKIRRYFDNNHLQSDPADLVISYLQTFEQALDDLPRFPTAKHSRIISERLALMQLGMRTLFVNSAALTSVLGKTLLPHYLRYPFNILQVDPVRNFLAASNQVVRPQPSLEDHLRDMFTDQARRISKDDGAPAPLFDHAIQILCRFGWKSDAEALFKSKLKRPSVMRSYLIGRSNELRDFDAANDIVMEFERNPEAKQMISIFEAIYFGDGGLEASEYPSGKAPISTSTIRTVATRYHRDFQTGASVVALYKLTTLLRGLPDHQRREIDADLDSIAGRLERERERLTPYEKAAITLLRDPSRLPEKDRT